MDPRRVLLADHDRTFSESLSGALPNGDSLPLEVRAVDLDSRELPDVAERYDALVLSAERGEHLEVVARLKASNGRFPIVVLVPPGEAALARRAREAGADTILPKNPDPGRMAPLVRTALEMYLLSVRTASLAGQAQQRSREMCALMAERRRVLTSSDPQVLGTPLEFPILVVDDDASLSQLLERALEKAGFERPYVAESVDRAIAFLSGDGEFGDRERFPLPSLVFLDLHMPRKSGFDFLEWFRGRPEFCQIVVIVNSSSENPDDVRRAYRLGASFFVTKPSTFDGMRDLAVAVRQFWVRLNT